MPDYENETCLSCHFFYDPGPLDEDWCSNKTIIKEQLKGWPSNDDRCDHFTRSLECRKVRALESIASDLSDFRGCLRDDGHGGCTFDVTHA